MELIHQYALIGSLVLDCFAGTCSTAKAALRLHRRCYCMELDQDLAAAETNLKKYYLWLVSNNIITRGYIFAHDGYFNWHFVVQVIHMRPNSKGFLLSRWLNVCCSRGNSLLLWILNPNLETVPRSLVLCACTRQSYQLMQKQKHKLMVVF